MALYNNIKLPGELTPAFAGLPTEGWQAGYIPLLKREELNF